MHIYIYIYILRADRRLFLTPHNSSVIAGQTPDLAALLYTDTNDAQWKGPIPWHRDCDAILSAIVPTVVASTPTKTADALFCGSGHASAKKQDLT